MEHQPKISLVEIILISPITFFIDLAQILLLLLGLNDYGLFSLIVLPSMQFYLRIKGVPSFFDLLCQLGEFIPYVNDVPLTTIGFLGSVWLDRHPKTAAMAMKVSGKAATIQKAAGRGGAPTGAPGAEEAGGAPRGTTPPRAPVPLEEIAKSDASGATQGEASIGGARIIRFPTGGRSVVVEEAAGDGASEKPKISEQAFGVPKSVFEEQLEPLTELPEPEVKKEATEERPRQRSGSNKGDDLKITPEDLGDRGLRRSGDALKITPEERLRRERPMEIEDMKRAAENPPESVGEQRETRKPQRPQNDANQNVDDAKKAA